MLHQRTENPRRATAVFQHGKKTIRTSLPGPSLATLFATPESTAPLRSPEGTACCSLARVLGSETDLIVCKPRVTQNPPSVPWVGGAVENGRSF
jgi:hypothetical protein